MSYSFTSKDAFKTITFAIKTALGKSIKVADVRNAAARSEGFPSASEYLTALDDTELTLHKLEIPLDFEALMVIVEEEKPSAPYCFLYIDTTVHIIALNESGRVDMRETAFSHDNVCELSGYIRAMNARLGYKDADDFKKAGFARYMDEIALGLKPSSECLTEVNDPFQDPELINILLHQDYGTAGYLQGLVAHLFNRVWECDLPSLLSNSDRKHYRFTMSIIEHYKSYGENSKSFMNVARQVVVNKRCALAYQEGKKLAEEYATSYRTVNVSHQEFLTWKHGLIRSIEDDEIQVEANEYDDKEMKALMDGVEGYEDMVNSEEEWA